MKKILLFSILSVGFVFNAEAQTKSAKKTVSKKAVANTNMKPSAKDTATVVLGSTSANAAFAPSGRTRLNIADPTINVMNQRASGVNINFRNSLVAGMPKSTYGIANGKILLRNTTATTSGSAYGSGSVGTGTSIIGTGTSEVSIGVNGKSPNAGNWLWGDRRPVYGVRAGDSAKRQ
jgi:hypothetical protein